MSEGSDYRLRLHMQWIDETSAPAKKAKKGLAGVAAAAKAMFGAAVVRQGVKFAAELIKIGAAAERQENALNNLAAAAGTSGDAIVKAIQGASDYTIDRMGAMEAANRAMVMDVAKTPAEFERLTKVAVALGRAMGVDAVKSIDDFITAGGRQSKLIADNLGLVVNAADAQMRYAEANNISVDSMDDAAKKQAFLTEMLRQGEVKMRDLGEQTLDSAGEIEQASAAWKDLKTSAGTTLATIASSTGILQNLSKDLRAVSETVDELDEMEITFKDLDDAMLRSWKTNESGAEALRNLRENYSLTQQDIARYSHTVATSSEVERYAFTQAAEAAAVEADAIQMTTDERNKMLFAMHQTNRAQEELASTTPPATRAIEEESEAAKKAGEELGRLAEASAQASFRMAADFHDRFGDMEDISDQFTSKREQEEARHQDAMANLRKRGASSAIKFNAEAEQKQLQKLQERLQLAELEQSAYTDKTKEATRLRKEFSIRDLREGITTQETLLADYHAGRLVKTGENVSGLMEEEDRLHQAKLKALKEEMAAAEEARKKEIGGKVAEAAIGKLDQALADDQITLDDYTTAVGEVQLAFGLTDQASINMTKGISAVVGALVNGSLAAGDFNESLALQAQIYGSSLLQAEKFGGILSETYSLVPAWTPEVDNLATQTGRLSDEMGNVEQTATAMRDGLDAFEKQSRKIRETALPESVTAPDAMMGLPSDVMGQTVPAIVELTEKTNLLGDAYVRTEQPIEAAGKALEIFRGQSDEMMGAIDTGLADMLTGWNTWSEKTGEHTTTVVGHIGNVKEATAGLKADLDKLTIATYQVRIRYDYPGAPSGRQHGGPVRAGKAYLVGESGPELFMPSASGQIVSNSQAFDSHDTYNFNTPHGPTAALEAQRRQRRRTMGRVM